MVVGRAARRAERRDAVEAAMGKRNRDTALDLLELLELAWHDCYGDVTPPDEVIDDVLLLAEGDLGRLVRACHLAVSDWRDLRVAADEHRGGS